MWCPVLALSGSIQACIDCRSYTISVGLRYNRGLRRPNALRAEFPSGVHEVRRGATKIMLPSWILACMLFSVGSFLFVLGAMALVNFKRVAKRVEGSPRPAWIPKLSIAGQVFVLAISVLFIGVGPFIFLESGVFLG